VLLPRFLFQVRTFIKVEVPGCRFSWPSSPRFVALGFRLIARFDGGDPLLQDGQYGVDHADKLVTTGVFAFSRNPIYVAFGCVLLGQFLVFPDWILSVYLAAGIWLFHRPVLREEEFPKAAPWPRIHGAGEDAGIFERAIRGVCSTAWRLTRSLIASAEDIKAAR